VATGRKASKGVFRDLLAPKDKAREYSLSVDEETYARVSEVSKLTGKSRPKVLRSFVELAYTKFKRVSKR